MKGVYRNKDGDFLNKVENDNNIVIVNEVKNKLEDKVEKTSK